MNIESKPHRRYNPLKGDWVVVSPQRAKRPWQTAPAPNMEKSAEYDPRCYLCPGNDRTSPSGKGAGHGQAKKIKNPAYKDIFIFDNDFQALIPEEDGRASDQKDSPLFQSRGLNGICKVICYSHQHNIHLGDMAEADIIKVIKAWVEQHAILGEQYQHVQIFENRGEMTGCSSPHPHGQIWALDYTPHLIANENKNQAEYFRKHNSPMLLDCLAAEEKSKTRIVCANQDWVLLVPYWAYWPYETLLLPRRECRSLQELGDEEISSLASMLQTLARKYDRLMNRIFPYMMGWHGSCAAGPKTPGELLHCHFYPPLLDSVKPKYTAGFEVFAELQRDITPEQAAKRLREC